MIGKLIKSNISGACARAARIIMEKNDGCGYLSNVCMRIQIVCPNEPKSAAPQAKSAYNKCDCRSSRASVLIYLLSIGHKTNKRLDMHLEWNIECHR